MSTRTILASALAATALAGCAVKTPPPEVARVAPPPLVAPPRPAGPAGTAVTFATPPRDSYGKYMTPNTGLTTEEALWHLRMGLNVAALSCFDANDSVNAAYANFLTLHKTRLARANTAMDKLWVERTSKADAKTARDSHSVDVYNFFALPMITRTFCAAADRVLATANATPSDQLDGYATVGLAELEAPFTEFFASYDSYKVAAAEWDRLYGTPEPVRYGASVANPTQTVFQSREVTYDPATNRPVGAPGTAPPTGDASVPLAPASPPTTPPVPGR